MKKLILAFAALLLIVSSYAYSQQQHQQPVLEPEIGYIDNMWDIVLQTPSLIDELQDESPEIVYHLVVENENCTACKAKALAICTTLPSWDDTVGELPESDYLIDNIIAYYCEDYGDF